MSTYVLQFQSSNRECTLRCSAIVYLEAYIDTRSLSLTTDESLQATRRLLHSGSPNMGEVYKFLVWGSFTRFRDQVTWHVCVFLNDTFSITYEWTKLYPWYFCKKLWNNRPVCTLFVVSVCPGNWPDGPLLSPNGKSSCLPSRRMGNGWTNSNTKYTESDDVYIPVLFVCSHCFTKKGRKPL